MFQEVHELGHIVMYFRVQLLKHKYEFDKSETKFFI